MSTVETNTSSTDSPSVGVESPDKPDGPIAAAMIAGGIGCFAMGLFTTLAEASASIKEALAWNAGVGPLSGKTGMAVIIWLMSWVVLHIAYRDRSANLQRALIITLVLVGLGFVMTFPTFFQAFAPAE